MDNSEKIILDLAGGTGAWSKPYADAGYDVRLITPSGIPLYDTGPSDVRTYEPPPDVYGVLAAPPCTMFSFARTNASRPRTFEKALNIVAACLNIIWQCQSRTQGKSPKKPYLKFWAIENPVGMLAWFLGRPSLVFNPYDYGDRVSKATALWGYFNEPIKSPVVLTKDERKKFDARSNDELPDLPNTYSCPDNFDKRAARRSITPPGFANAFFKANQ